MRSKVGELFLELCLLRLRYSGADIEEVARVHAVVDDPDLRKIVIALRAIEVATGLSKPSRSKAKSRKPSNRTLNVSNADAQLAISYFIERLSSNKILRTREQLDSFARSIGITESYDDREEMGGLIRKNLESMPPSLALQKIRAVDRKSWSGSDSYVELAKALMKG